METVTTIEAVRQAVRRARGKGKTIGLVPTMGALHEGHLSLVEAARAKCGFVVVSIFINPTQFGPTEDLDKYPRDMAGDVEKCAGAGVDIIFAPDAKEMYPSQNLTWVDVEGLTENLCGNSRAGHFRGVTTVCAKLFNIVGADYAFFGQKDAQQAAVIKRMVADMNMPLTIVVCPIVREADGLAMSSRNKYLSGQQRKDAVLLSKSLAECERLIALGRREAAVLEKAMLEILTESELIEPEYVSIVDGETLEPVERIDSQVLVAIAVRIGKTRLIDNIVVDVNKG